MKKGFKVSALATSCLLALVGCNDDTMSIDEQAKAITQSMTLEEKIAQKIVMSFRYWCDDGNAECTDGLTEINDSVRHVIEHNKVGGVILFSSNLVDTDQTAELIWNMQDAVEDEQPVGLFMTIDQEGGNVVRLPRTQGTNLPGNMALGSAYLNSGDSQLAYDAGKVLATEIGSVGFNVNFAPVVDVQSNPLNPVINVRSYGEDPEAVGILGGQAAQGMAAANVIGAFKHFPGHGDTAVDSHYGLPIVDKTLEEAHAIDLAPYKTAIEQGVAPDMIMTAHIQYPALDDSTITSSVTGEEMLVPATLSYKIQTELLREELNYQGLTITDALDMAGIADYFGEAEAVIKTFQAGVDIALMPTLFRTTSGENQLTELIDEVVEAVELGELSEADIDRSVERIITTKLERNILNHNGAQLLTDIQSQAQEIIGNDEHQAIEKDITDKAMTLITNEGDLLPLPAHSIGKVHIIMPDAGEGDEAEALKAALIEHGVTNVSGVIIANTLEEIEKRKIDDADTIIVGTSATEATPVEDNGDYGVSNNKLAQANSGSLVFNVNETQSKVEVDNNQFAYNMMDYAYNHAKDKNVIHLTMRAPYDEITFDEVSHSTIATYNYYGVDDNGVDLGANAMDAAARVILGDLNPAGKLPVNIFEQNEDGEMGDLKYEIGHGLSYPQ
ncbi:glycoside hydrolase family 3 protein [Vibrio sp. Isolate25]|uniref:glycoside hydrolase family 3 protein n=1 Tax=unclassified Vibrio TaxID=2614977 RepID=UPI001EFE3941|nr:MULTISPECIES: glycoside hydrolase family 3 protein [unclassified Vibrio]MCG9596285.1 glycoside hydrolase family 3 protein [Vibrio sp. Isolate25]MCG9676676.1 glycoside hydrolase family 3 protein [Vibrio sp. Isolate24]